MGARVVRLYSNRQARSDAWSHPVSFVLKLYIAGRTPRAESTIEELRRSLDEALEGEYQLTVHDVMEEPQLAEN